MKQRATRRIAWAASLAGVAALTAAVCGAAPTSGSITATPATLSAVLAKAGGGEQIVLAPGDYGTFVWSNRGFSPGISIDATRARFAELRLDRTFGIAVRGGTVVGRRDNFFGVLIDHSHHIRVSDMAVRGPKTGISVNNSDDVAIVGNQLDGVRSDGVNVAISHRVLVERNVCRNFDPIPAVYAPNGKLVRDGDHPDCIQGWSRREAAPTSDITIIGNVGEGKMAGIFFNQQVIDGADTGGYDRLVVKDNVMTVAFFHGLTLEGVRGAVVTGNVIRAVPGSRLAAYPYPQIRPWLKVTGTDIVQCGNTVSAFPDGPGTRRCKRTK